MTTKVTSSDARRFDPRQFLQSADGHVGRLGIGYQAHGPDWVDLALPYHADLVGDRKSGVLASGPLLAMIDTAASLAVWTRLGNIRSLETLDLRIDYLRSAAPGRTVIGRCQCYRITRSIAFIRGQANDGEAEDPLAHVAGSYRFTEATP